MSDTVCSLFYCSWERFARWGQANLPSPGVKPQDWDIPINMPSIEVSASFTVKASNFVPRSKCKIPHVVHNCPLCDQLQCRYHMFRLINGQIRTVEIFSRLGEEDGGSHDECWLKFPDFPAIRYHYLWVVVPWSTWFHCLITRWGSSLITPLFQTPTPHGPALCHPVPGGEKEEQTNKQKVARHECKNHFLIGK